jgi:hypothetical protein
MRVAGERRGLGVVEVEGSGEGEDVVLIGGLPWLWVVVLVVSGVRRVMR